MAKKTEPKPANKPGYVTITLPLSRDKDKQGPRKVWSNGIGYSVPRGIPVEVPIDVADVIRTSDREDFRAAEYLYEK